VIVAQGRTVTIWRNGMRRYLSNMRDGKGEVTMGHGDQSDRSQKSGGARTEIKGEGLRGN